MNSFPPEQEYSMAFPSTTPSSSAGLISTSPVVSFDTFTCYDMAPQVSFHPNSLQRPRVHPGSGFSMQYAQSQYPSPPDSNSSRGSRIRDIGTAYNPGGQRDINRERFRNDPGASESLEYRPLLSATQSPQRSLIHFSLTREFVRAYGLALDMRVHPQVGMPVEAMQYGDLWAATNRPAHVRIVSHDFPWAIDIKAPEEPVGAERVLNCSDIWVQIYNALQEPIQDSDWAHLSDMATRDPNSPARRRLDHLVSVARHQISRGEPVSLVRLHWLMGETYFVGVERDEGHTLSARRLLPGRERCAETWIAYFSDLSEQA